MLEAYHVIVLSENDSVAVSGTEPKSFQITYNGDIARYTAEDVKAVILKTMDTGPFVEDLYAEIHVQDTIYVIPSESPLYNDAIVSTVHSVVPLDLEASIEASTYHHNKTFVLYQKMGADVEIEDSDEKRIAILEASLESLHKAGRSAGTSGLVFALLSFCPMYLLFGKGEHRDQLVNLAAIRETLIPIFTSHDKCPNSDQFEKRRLPAEQYLQMLASENDDAMINFPTEQRFLINSRQIQELLLPLVLLRGGPIIQEQTIIKQEQTSVNQKQTPVNEEKNEKKKRSGLFKKLFGK